MKMDRSFLKDSLTFNDAALGGRAVPEGDGIGKGFAQARGVA